MYKTYTNAWQHINTRKKIAKIYESAASQHPSLLNSWIFWGVFPLGGGHPVWGSNQAMRPFLGAHVGWFLHIFTYFVYFCICLHIFYIFFYIFWWFFDIKLIVNKRGSPEAPPIHYPINFISKTFKKYKKHLRIYNNIWKHTKIYKSPSLSVTWSLSF